MEDYSHHRSYQVGRLLSNSTRADDQNMPSPDHSRYYSKTGLEPPSPPAGIRHYIPIPRNHFPSHQTRPFIHHHALHIINLTRCSTPFSPLCHVWFITRNAFTAPVNPYAGIDDCCFCSRDLDFDCYPCASLVTSQSSGTLFYSLERVKADAQVRNTPLRSSLPSLSTRLTPFMVPIAFRLIARHIRPEAGESLLLASHYAKLDRRLASSFFLQGPMWVGWTRPKIMALVKGIERIPLFGLAGEFVEGYIPLVDDYFYCECGQAFGADSQILLSRAMQVSGSCTIHA